jgi:hypothetical protein
MREEEESREHKINSGVKLGATVGKTAANEMTHPSLLNPFYSKQEQAQNISGRTARATRCTPVCSHCRSDDIISHATVQWSNEAQEWELANTFAQPAHCNSCNGPCEIVWLPLN